MTYPVETIGNIARTVLNFALPPRCVSCGRITDGDDRFCLQCWQTLDHIDQGCRQCGDPRVSIPGDAAICGACMADPPPFDTMRAAVRYDDTARTVALRLKYGGRIGVARTIARALHRHVIGYEDALLVPVPLHRWRLWRRGYNQAALIAGKLAGGERDRLVMDALLRVRATPYLRAMNAAERRKTVRGAFAANPDRRAQIAGRRILLIDDVYTSGATVGACAKVLKRAGASEIHVRCWARVCDSEGDDY